MIANAFDFEPREFYDAPKESEATPEVKFSRDGAGGDAKDDEPAVSEKSAPENKG